MQEPTVIEAKYGPCIITKVKILQNGEDVAIFSKLGDSIAASKTKGQFVLIAKNAKGKYVIVDDTPTMSNGNIKMNRPSSQQEGSYYTHSNNGSNTSPTQTYSQPASNGSNTASNSEEDILDLPVFSQRDRQAMAQYVKSQSKLLRYCYDVICQDFPELAQTDPRGARSLAISLLISANQCRDRYLK